MYEKALNSLDKISCHICYRELYFIKCSRDMRIE